MVGPEDFSETKDIISPNGAALICAVSRRKAGAAIDTGVLADMF